MSKNYILETGDETQLILEIGVNSTGATVITTHHASYLTPYTEPDTEEVRKEVCDKCMNETEDLAYQLYSPKIEEAYQRGLNDAWEAARKIRLNANEGGLSTDALTIIFGNKTINQIFKELSASEVTEKIRQYEQKEIKVGHEVEARAGRAVIIEILREGKTVRYMYPDASTGVNDLCNLTLTGRYFPEIAEVFKKMKGEG